MTEKTLDDCQSLEEVEELCTGRMSEHHLCIDCGVDTAPGHGTKKEIAKEIWEAKLAGKEWSSTIVFDETTEVYMVRDAIWKKARMEPWGGCLCIGCLEKRLGRKLKPKDFNRTHPFHGLPSTPRLMKRRKAAA